MVGSISEDRHGWRVALAREIKIKYPDYQLYLTDVIFRSEVAHGGEDAELKKYAIPTYEGKA